MDGWHNSSDERTLANLLATELQLDKSYLDGAINSSRSTFHFASDQLSVQIVA